ncbi:MAG: hypothetical protein CMO66_03165 [Verrucomicrobiales bacterium]|nr:hypothetical protein [Verrucomicrobiales bacterium]|tara:strand:+ start:466 stop:2967 length:2502 start_codon:yes stop_codon:yes gene_type:complete
MKSTEPSPPKRKIRLRFKAKDLERIDIDALRRQLGVAKEKERGPKPSIEAEPEPVVEPTSPATVHEPSISGQAQPGIQQKISWRYVAIGAACFAVLGLIAWGMVGVVSGLLDSGLREEAKPKVQGNGEKAPPAPLWPRIPETKPNSQVQVMAQKGNPDAAFDWGVHLAGKLDGNPELAPEVFNHFRIAAEEGHGPAMMNLAWCYENGVGTPVEITEGIATELRAEADLPISLKGENSRMGWAILAGMVGWFVLWAVSSMGWSKRMAGLSEEERGFVGKAAHVHLGGYGEVCLKSIGGLVLCPLVLGFAWMIYQSGIWAGDVLYASITVGLPASVLLLYIVSRFRWEPFAAFNYHAGTRMPDGFCEETEFHMLIRKLPLLVMLTLLFWDLVELGWAFCLAVGVVWWILWKGVDPLPQIDLKPPRNGLEESKKYWWPIQNLPRFIFVAAAYYLFGWFGFLAGFSICAIGMLPLTGSKPPPRLPETSAQFIERRVIHNVSAMRVWWGVWATLLLVLSLTSEYAVNMVREIGIISFIIAIVFLAWMWPKGSKIQPEAIRYMPRWIAVAWAQLVIGYACWAFTGLVWVQFTFVVLGLLGLSFCRVILLNGERTSLGRQLRWGFRDECWLMSWWRIKSPHLLFTAAVVGALLVLWENGLVFYGLKQWGIGTVVLGGMFILAAGKGEEESGDNRNLSRLAKPDLRLSSVLAENGILILAGGMLIALLVPENSRFGWFEYFWAATLFMGMPIMFLVALVWVKFRRLSLFGKQFRGREPIFVHETRGLQVRWGRLCAVAVLVGILAASTITGLTGGMHKGFRVIVDGWGYQVIDGGFYLPDK